MPVSQWRLGSDHVTTQGACVVQRGAEHLLSPQMPSSTRAWQEHHGHCSQRLSGSFKNTLSSLCTDLLIHVLSTEALTAIIGSITGLLELSVTASAGEMQRKNRQGRGTATGRGFKNGLSCCCGN